VAPQPASHALAQDAQGEVPVEESAVNTFDPWEGIDRNGRIPAVEKPEDLPNPERWRYIPEGHIKPGNVFRRLLVTSFILPFIFRDSDVGTGFGVALTDVDFRLKRRREFLGAFLSYSTKGQQSYSAVWQRWLNHIDLPDGGVLQEERSFARGRAGYRKALTLRYFGLGPDTEESDESSYTDSRYIVQLGFQRSLPRPGSNLVLALAAQGDFHELSDGEVDGVPSTANAYPLAFDSAEHANLGWLIGSLRWDTRDSQVNPYRGWMVGSDVDAALAQSGGKVGAVFRLYASKIFPVPGLFHRGGDTLEENPPTDVLAFGFTSEQAVGDLPFFALPSLGGAETLRGFIEGRFRDRSSWSARSEYRFWVLARGFRIPFTKTLRIERAGLALFYELGAVAHDVGDLFQSRARHSYGIGYRMMIERSAPFRIDLGFSDEGLYVTAGFGLTF
jgi:hypothetical protein